MLVDENMFLCSIAQHEFKHQHSRVQNKLTVVMSIPEVSKVHPHQDASISRSNMHQKYNNVKMHVL